LGGWKSAQPNLLSDMKNKTWLNLLSVGLLMAGGSLGARGQSYSIDWFKISGGGGTSGSGAYSVSSTIGQPDAGGPQPERRIRAWAVFGACFRLCKRLERRC
jgi:hypothetical protein